MSVPWRTVGHKPKDRVILVWLSMYDAAAFARWNPQGKNWELVQDGETTGYVGRALHVDDFAIKAWCPLEPPE